jgi:hypothetical protein
MKSIARSSASVIAIAFIVSVAPGCGLARFPHPDCVLGDGRTRSTQAAKKVDLSALKLYRNTFAVSRVGPLENHFTVWFHDIEPEFLQLRATEDSAGDLRIEVDNGMWGGIGAPPKDPKPPPADIAALQENLENEAQRRCPYARNWVFQYDGEYREVDLEELVNVSKIASGERIGWKGKVTLEADESLTHVLPKSPDYESGLGLFEIYEPAQWVIFTPPPNEMGSVLFVERLWKMKAAPPPASAEAALLDKTLESARRFRDHAASPPLAEITAMQGTTLLPPGLDLPFRIGLSVYGRTKNFADQKQVKLAITLKTSAIMNGNASGETEQNVGNVHLKMRAAFTLMPSNPPPDANDIAHVSLLLHLHVEDQNGHAFDREYPAYGDFLTDGSAVVAQDGVHLSDPSTPDTQRQFQGSFPEGGEIASVDFSFGIKNDPREQ